jgi:hypothetical protein
MFPHSQIMMSLSAISNSYPTIFVSNKNLQRLEAYPMVLAPYFF